MADVTFPFRLRLAPVVAMSLAQAFQENWERRETGANVRIGNQTLEVEIVRDGRLGEIVWPDFPGEHQLLEELGYQ